MLYINFSPFIINFAQVTIFTWSTVNLRHLTAKIYFTDMYLFIQFDNISPKTDVGMLETLSQYKH